MSRILVIEDDDMLNAGICFNLQKSGYDILSVQTLAEAKEKIKTSEINLILLDVNLPDGNGFEFVNTIKDETNIPFVFLTAHNLDEEIISGFDIGAEDYITKPFNIKIVLKRIENILKRYSKNEEKEIYEGKDLKINLDSRVVLKNNEQLLLTPTEIDLLSVFIKNKDTIITRKVILEKLWDSKNNFVDEHTLTINISRLRSKLDSETEKYIKTIYGIGYKWVGD